MKSYVADAITPEIAANVSDIEARGDAGIDLSDMPEVTDWSNAVRGAPARIAKEQVTLSLDADLLEWFRSHGGARGYQGRINTALRRFVEQAEHGAVAE